MSRLRLTLNVLLEAAALTIAVVYFGATFYLLATLIETGVHP